MSATSAMGQMHQAWMVARQTGLGQVEQGQGTSNGPECIWQGLAYVEDAQDMLEYRGTWEVRPGGGWRGCRCVPVYTGYPRGRGTAVGVAGRIWERWVSLGVRKEVGQCGRVGSVSCEPAAHRAGAGCIGGPCWGPVAHCEWP